MLSVELTWVTSPLKVMVKMRLWRKWWSLARKPLSRSLSSYTLTVGSTIDDGFKDVFFYNLLGTLYDNPNRRNSRTVAQLGALIAYVDEYPVLGNGPFWWKYVYVHAAKMVWAWRGWWLGLRPWVEEYTPERLWSIARRKERLCPEWRQFSTSFEVFKTDQA